MKKLIRPQLFLRSHIRLLQTQPAESLTNLKSLKRRSSKKTIDEARKNVSLTLTGSQKQLNSQEHEAVHESQKQSSQLWNKRQIYDRIALKSYLSVCVDVGQINRAFNILVKYSASGMTKSMLDVDHYNIILKGWAKLGSATQIFETRLMMDKNDIKPNAETFAYILLNYSNNKDHSKISLQRLVREMKNKQIDPRELFQGAYFGPIERKSIKKLLMTIDPEYDDIFCNEHIGYNCKLTAGINQTKQVPYECFGQVNMADVKCWADEQRSIEWKSSVPIKSVDNFKQSNDVRERYIKLWNVFSERWRKALTQSFDETLNNLREECTVSDKIHIYPYLCSVDKKMLINLMLDEIEINATLATFSVSTSQLHLRFGTKIMIRYMKTKSIEDGSHTERQQIYTSYINQYCNDPVLMGRMNSREYIQTKASETKNYAIYRDRCSCIQEWPHSVVATIGKILYRIIIREVKFDPEVVKHPKRGIQEENMVHAFYTAFFQIDSTHKMKEEFRAHQDFEKLYQKACSTRIKFDYTYLPTCSPPLPWLSPGFGGYLTHKTDLVRVNNSSAEQASAIKIIDYQKLYPSLDSLNALGLCPWIVNKEILNLVIKVFESGGNRDLDIPLDQAKMSIEAPPQLQNGSSKADKILYNQKKKKHDQKMREMSALRYECLYRLSIANHFREKIFWFPHNMDFRGRTYPIPPHFNHLGSDLARSLLLFAKGQPLGQGGLDWLKIHLINLVGKMKKSSIQERLNYTNSILHLEVLDSADNPLDGRQWWMDNENPWQVLACCKEIARAIRSEDCEQYISHFPIHQDGSCNGLQHYAALGRDVSGGQAVNLIPSDKPQDVYSGVVDIVEAVRRVDAEKGLKAAIMLDGFIQRKVIKQTVMTTVYGVTRYGARQQIARQLTAKGYPDREIWQAALYLTGKTFEAIGQMFNKSRLIQDWFSACAYIIASKYKTPVSWETPLGFPVNQPYTLPRKARIKHVLSGGIESEATVYNDPYADLNSGKQRTAFPPNYIHSLDSSHMMLTSLFCQRSGITFVSVHDCFWTHPSTVDLMNQICREQFVALHSEPLLSQLSEQFVEKIQNLDPVAVSRGKIIQRRADNKQTKELSTPTSEATAEQELAMLKSIPVHTLASKYDLARREAFEKDYSTLRAVPQTGQLDLTSILKSTYFFS